MTFPLTIIYLNREYVYDVKTTDAINFICRCRLTEHEQFGTPPEVVELERGKHLKPNELGAYRAQLHSDLLAGIDDFIKES